MSAWNLPEQTEGGKYRIPLRSDFAVLISQLSVELVHLLDAPVEGMDFLAALSGGYELKEPPADPVLQQLLPDMSDDPIDAIELRSFTEDTLRLLKSQRLQRIVGVLENTPEELIINEDEAWDWLSAFNDMRLYLGMRLSQYQGSVELVEPQWSKLEEKAEVLFSEESVDLPQEQLQESLICLAYIVVSWWQDSLLQEVINKQ
ncbi:hypothetical protein HMPREF0044_0671 [Gleimia coleocanis DSM 15436]|uniref:Uncharacterized protein n=1 Tax=Gleimia coleocanis DSM 15436 TaxID=525245 RepID=C0W0S8_9ACTO|nr:DUF2017 family protein [Gleimia coleocanis]EEH63652.1 hypothetical protein HMPREF0044_0671 [Gleimia coleocanis DSM 15436]